MVDGEGEEENIIGGRRRAMAARACCFGVACDDAACARVKPGDR